MGGGGYLQLTGIRFNCSYSTGEGVMRRRLKKVLYFFCKPSTENIEYLPRQMQELISSFIAGEKLDKYIHSCPGVEELKGTFIC